MRNERTLQVKENKSGTFWQALATIVIWTMVTGGIALGGVFLVGSMGEEVLGYFFMLFAAAVISTGFIWDWGRLPGDSHRRKRHAEQDNYNYDFDLVGDEKRKRDRLSDALRTLSDDELLRLRQRIADGEIDEDDLAYVMREESTRR
jgi:hypothetical protein